jgi:sugar O-acyltransferase (sialic acid O-acetyltransferase NeuD family)
MATDLVIVGAGGFGREVAWLASEVLEPYRVIGFLDDQHDLAERDLGGFPHLGPVTDWQRHADASFVVAIGNPRTRASVVERMNACGTVNYGSLVHRDCRIGPACSLGAGSIVCAGCILTTNVVVGAHTIINIGSTIGHDVRIGAFVTLAPQAAVSGCVTIATGVEVGTAASIRQGLTIGEGGMLGMGSALTKNIPPNTFFFGVPAKRVKELPAFGKRSGQATS